MYTEDRAVNDVQYTPVVIFLSDGSVLEFEDAWDVLTSDDLITFAYKRNGRNHRASFDVHNIAGVSVAMS